MIDLKQVFKVGDTSFKLLAVKRESAEIAVVGGVFTGGKPTLTITRAKPVTLVNTATGVRYPIRFSLATSGLTSTVQAPSAPTAATPSVPTPATTTATSNTTTSGR